MGAIMGREIKAYFQTPLGYVFIGATYMFCGLYFYAYNLFGGASDLSRLFSVLFSVALFLIPILTMRLLSEERKQKTDQLLLTAPVSSSGIAMGKYLSAVCVYIIAISSTLVCAAILSFFANVNWVLALGNFAGLTLLGMALIAICLYISALTESQLIAAVGGFSVSILVMLLDALKPLVESDWIKKLFDYMSFSARYTPFTSGIFALSNVVFFVSIAALFLYLTTERLDGRRCS